MKILVIALSGIGDALMFTPSVQKLKKDFPNSQIDLLAMYSGVADIYQNLPEVNKVLFCNFLQQSKLKSLIYVLALRNKYDITINIYPSNRREYNLINFLIGAKKRAAINYLRKNFSNLGFLNTHTINENNNLHNVEENIKLCELISGKISESISPLQIILNKSDEEYAAQFLSDNNIKASDLIFGFHPGCSTLKNHDKRRWETEKFAELGKKLIDNYSAKIFLFGGSEEHYLKKSICNEINSQYVFSVDTNSLLKTASIMKRCNLFVTNDSSLMHVAAALKLKVVAIIGPTNEKYIYPWQTDFKIASLHLDCSPCFYYSPKPLTCSRKDTQFKCIKDLKVEMVFEKMEEYLK
jgi:heptosyltransferase-2